MVQNALDQVSFPIQENTLDDNRRIALPNGHSAPAVCRVSYLCYRFTICVDCGYTSIQTQGGGGSFQSLFVFLPVCLTVCPSTFLSYLFIDLSIYLPSNYLSNDISIYRSIYRSIYLSVCLSVCLFVSLSICLSVYLRPRGGERKLNGK